MPRHGTHVKNIVFSFCSFSVGGTFLFSNEICMACTPRDAHLTTQKIRARTFLQFSAISYDQIRLQK